MVAGADRVDLAAALRGLARPGRRRGAVRGRARASTASWWPPGLIDEVCLTVARPCWSGGGRRPDHARRRRRRTPEALRLGSGARAGRRHAAAALRAGLSAGDAADPTGRPGSVALGLGVLGEQPELALEVGGVVEVLVDAGEAHVGDLVERRAAGRARPGPTCSLVTSAPTGAGRPRPRGRRSATCSSSMGRPLAAARMPASTLARSNGTRSPERLTTTQRRPLRALEGGEPVAAGQALAATADGGAVVVGTRVDDLVVVARRRPGIARRRRYRPERRAAESVRGGEPDDRCGRPDAGRPHRRVSRRGHRPEALAGHERARTGPIGELIDEGADVARGLEASGRWTTGCRPAAPRRPRAPGAAAAAADARARPAAAGDAPASAVRTQRAEPVRAR